MDILKNTLIIPSDFSYLNDVEQFVQDMLDIVHASSFISGSIQLCVSELVNNAIYHGNKLDKSKRVTIFAECCEDDLIIQVADEGNGFDYQDIPDPTSSNNVIRERGRGLFIVRNLTDRLLFSNNGSVINLKFKLNSEY